MRYAVLEPLRGLAALWVFCYHYHFSNSFQATFPRLHSLLKAGDLGVPMFFVLSGFCVTASAVASLTRAEPAWSFLFRRLRRIYPPYWGSVVIVAALPFVIEFVSSLKTGQFTPPQAGGAHGFLRYSMTDWLLVGTLAKVFDPVPGAVDLQTKFAGINAVYWTLAIEVQFYVVVALGVWARRLYAVLGAATIASVPFVFLPASSTTGIFFPFWPMFAVGAALHWLFENGARPSTALRASWSVAAGLAAAALAAWFVRTTLTGRGVDGLTFAAGFGVLLFAGERLDASFVDRVLNSERLAVRAAARIFMTLGAMSYSLYLLHGRLQHLSMQLARQLTGTDRIVFDLGSIAMTCLMCLVFYRVCERPFMSARQRETGAPVYSGGASSPAARVGS